MTVTPQQLLPGQVVEFTLTIGNPHGVSLSEVRVTNALSAVVEYLNTTSTRGTASHDAASNTLTLVIDSMAPNETVVARISGRVSAQAQAPAEASNSAGICQAGGCCATASAAALIVPGGIPVTGAGPAAGEMLSAALALLAGILASLAGGWLLRQRARG
jgi:uncharacterized repeat protein (TIGR01451 family)